MNKYYYKKSPKSMRIVRKGSLLLCIIGIILTAYTFFPLLSWHIYFEPVFASSYFEPPIPQTTVLNPNLVKDLVKDAANILGGLDYTNAENWFPNYKYRSSSSVDSYTISIPKLKIENAVVSTTDTDLSKHLIQYGGTATVPDKGNSVIFGHSTLPQLFNPKDYKTIFAKVHTLKVGEQILATVENVTYQYKISSINVVNPDDTTMFTQQYDDSYITLVTCTPPGTIWKRLIIKAKLQPIT